MCGNEPCSPPQYNAGFFIWGLWIFGAGHAASHSNLPLMGFCLAILLLMVVTPLLLFHLHGGGVGADRRAIWWLCGCQYDSSSALLRDNNQFSARVIKMRNALEKEKDKRSLRMLDFLSVGFMYVVIPSAFYYRAFAPSFFFSIAAVAKRMRDTDMDFFRLLSWAGLFFPTYNFAAIYFFGDSSSPQNDPVSLLFGYFTGISVRTILNATCHVRFSHHMFQCVYTMTCIMGITFVSPTIASSQFVDVIRIYLVALVLISTGCILKHYNEYEILREKQLKRCQRYLELEE